MPKRLTEEFIGGNNDASKGVVCKDIFVEKIF